MNVIIDDEIHRVVYIEYSNGIPFSVITVCDGRECEWDFFPNAGDENNLQAFNSGSGPSTMEINAPQWANGYLGEFWISDKVKLKGEVKNGTRLRKPIIIRSFDKKSLNPFEVADITDYRDYCDKCGHESIEYCYDHKYIDDDGNERYIDDDSYV